MQVIRDNGRDLPQEFNSDLAKAFLQEPGVKRVEVFKGTPEELAKRKQKSKYKIRPAYQKKPKRYRFEGVDFSKLPSDIAWATITTDKEEARKAIDKYPYWFMRGTKAELAKTK